MDSTPNTCADAVRQERLQRKREIERQQREEETAEDREQQWLVSVFAIGIAYAMLAATQ